MPQEQSMKAETAAKKLGVLLSATPEEFRAGPVTRSELTALQKEPPEWLGGGRGDGAPLRAHRAAEGAAGVAGRAATHRPASTAGRGGQARRLDRGAGARWGDR